MIKRAIWTLSVFTLLGGCQTNTRETGNTEPGESSPGTSSIVPSSEAAGLIVDLRGRFSSPAQAQPVERSDDSDVARHEPRLSAGIAQRFQIDGAGLRPEFDASSARATAHVVFPKRSTQPFHMEDADSGMAADVLLRDARDANAETADGYVVYRNAHASGATMLHRALLSGTEDYLSFVLSRLTFPAPCISD